MGDDPLYRDRGENNKVYGIQIKYPNDQPILRGAKISMVVYTEAAARGANGWSGKLTGVEVPKKLRVDEIQFTVG
jgi:hypothetical protein